MAEDIRDIGRLNPSQLFTREEAHDVYERVCDLVRQRNELQEEVAALQETLAIFAALRDLMYESPRALYHVGQNGHVALPRADAARDQHTALPVGAPAAPHDDPANEDLDATVELPMPCATQSPMMAIRPTTTAGVRTASTPATSQASRS
jgi:hypothetical protein